MSACHELYLLTDSFFFIINRAICPHIDNRVATTGCQLFCFWTHSKSPYLQGKRLHEQLPNPDQLKHNIQTIQSELHSTLRAETAHSIALLILIETYNPRNQVNRYRYSRTQRIPCLHGGQKCSHIRWS